MTRKSNPPIGSIPDGLETHKKLVRAQTKIDLANPHPLYCVWEITLKCDLGCKHCGSRAGKTRPEELSTEACLDVVSQLSKLGVREVTLIGGEAYLREDWDQIAQAISDQGMVCGITTGARNLTPERIERAVADMESIIECFLWLARNQVEHESHPEVFVSPIARGLATRYESLSAAKGLRILVVGEACVAAPDAVLKIVLGNLLANAVHFTEEGEIKIALSDDCISVQDTGSGLTGLQTDMLTEAFVRGETSDGYGLGLAIVRSLCERFGWTLSLRNRPTKGAVVTIELPSGGAHRPAENGS